jgi:hypothetical protein
MAGLCLEKPHRCGLLELNSNQIKNISLLHASKASLTI